MSTRPELRPFAVITNGNMSADVTSNVTIIQKISMLSYSYSWTGSTPVGTISVQVSNDYSLDATGNVSNAGTWNKITFLDSSGDVTTDFSVSGNTGVGGLDVTQTGFYAIRTVYDRTSGTGTLQSFISGKVS